MFENKKVFIRKDQLALRDEILRFPQIKHDDLLDALKSQLQITFPCDKKVEDYKVDPSKPKLDWIEKKMWDHVRSFDKRRVRETGDWEEI